MFGVLSEVGASLASPEAGADLLCAGPGVSALRRGRAVSTGSGSGVMRGSGNAGSVATESTWRRFHNARLWGESEDAGVGVAIGVAAASAPREEI